MNIKQLLFLSTLITFILASIGDDLPEFQHCVKLCITNKCENKKIQSPLTEDFNKYSVAFPFNYLFGWDCVHDCDYKCQQIITSIRTINNQAMVKFHGKWPFTRIFGITELASVIFSLLNFHINWINFKKINFQYKKTGNLMYLQYLILLCISMVGWIFSTIFHIRDTATTEILDYFGASLIIFTNFYVITTRYFEWFNCRKLIYYQIFMVVVYMCHILKMTTVWDYQYNLIFHLLIGCMSIVFWILHSIRVARYYSQNFTILNNSITLLPYETKILTKLNFLGISKTKYIPYIPILLNLWLIFAMGFEIWEFKPWAKLIDSHSLWHLGSWVPQLIWFDWNIWDLELYNFKTNKDPKD